MSSTTIQTTCSFCSVGCNLEFTLEEGKVVKARGAADYPVNLGKCCPKGFNLLKPFQVDERVGITPLLKDKEGHLASVSWDNALKTFTERFKTIQKKHGKESVAFISTGQMTTEDCAALGLLSRMGMGIFGDGNTRQCMASAVVAYKQAFGFDSPPFSYKDLEESDVLIFVGANSVIAHPIIWNRVKMNKNNPEIIVIDPRKTETARASTLHLALEPKTDLLVLYAIAKVLLQNNWIDKDYIKKHTKGFEEFATHVQGYSVEDVASKAGLKPQDIIQTAEKIHKGKRVSIWWTMGVNQSHQGVRTAQAIINLCLMTGHIGRPGTGPNSITGQSNAMGSRLYSNTTALYGGRDFTNPAHRREVAEILDIDEGIIPDHPTLPYNKIIEEVAKGNIKGLWIIATNPIHSWIDKNSLIEALKNLDFLVVQDLYSTTETAQTCDLFLPAAGSGEKNGSFINSERRIGVVRQVLTPPGEALADFEIFRRIADAWGCGNLFQNWTNQEETFKSIIRLSKGQPCDITGIDGYDSIESMGGVQWPCSTEKHLQETHRRLFEDGVFYTPDGRAKFIFEDPRPLPELADKEFPFTLLTGRGTMVQFHTQTRTGKVPLLRKLYPQNAYAQINPADAKKIGIEDKDRVRLLSRRAAVEVDAEVTDAVKAGHIFVPMHYFEANRLTFPAFDPYSFQPSYKFGAIRIEKIT